MTDVAYLCVTAIVLLILHHRHEVQVKGSDSVLTHLHRRVKALEERKDFAIDPALIEDMKSKVEALRLAQGLRLR